MRQVWREAAAVVPAPDVTGDLIRDLAGGDVEALGRLYDHVAPLVYGVAHRVIGDTTLAEEVTQDVFVSIWKQAPRYDKHRGRGRAWILMIAHRRAVDRVRSEQSARDHNDRYGREAATPAHDEVAEAVETRFEHGVVTAALDDLTPLQRQAVVLAYYSSHTYREVAHTLGIPLGTAKTRIRDGLVGLRHAVATMDTYPPHE